MTCSIKVWDVTTGVCSHTLKGNYLGYDMELQGDTMVCRGHWFVEITGIQLIGKLVVTSSDGGTVKLWDVTTGQFIRNLLVLESGVRLEKMLR